MSDLKRLSALEHIRLRSGMYIGAPDLLSVHYPRLQWRGCIKAEIEMPELALQLREALGAHLAAWAVDHPNVVSQLQDMRVFHFPEIWLR